MQIKFHVEIFLDLEIFGYIVVVVVVVVGSEKGSESGCVA